LMCYKNRTSLRAVDSTLARRGRGGRYPDAQ
jgi:hypothetical protein